MTYDERKKKKDVFYEKLMKRKVEKAALEKKFDYVIKRMSITTDETTIEHLQSVGKDLYQELCAIVSAVEKAYENYGEGREYITDEVLSFLKD